MSSHDRGEGGTFLRIRCQRARLLLEVQTTSAQVERCQVDLVLINLLCTYQLFPPPPPPGAKVGDRWGFDTLFLQWPHPWEGSISSIPPPTPYLPPAEGVGIYHNG
ncbi:MAG: hypothetical protein MJE68_18475, partial [Proteobacteria bacterium]|nr:hypothetical protein [Pseudomonadota bacterium]